MIFKDNLNQFVGFATLKCETCLFNPSGAEDGIFQARKVNIWAPLL